MPVAPEGFYNAPPKPDASTVNAPRGYDGNTYLHELCDRGAPPALIKEALAMGADINALNKQKLPPLGLAILRGETATVRALVEAGAELYFAVGKNGPDTLNFNATYFAAAFGSREKLAAVLEKGGDAFVNCTGIDQNGYDNKLKPLHAAIGKWKAESIPLLVDAGAFVDEEAGVAKETPLMIAISSDSEDAVSKLVRRGASLEYRHSETGDTPLMHACTLDKRWTGQKLLNLGADTQAANKKGRTPLMQAAALGNSILVTEILKRSPDINARDKEGQTALMLAAARASSETVNLLLKAGADPLLTDSFNRSARAHALNSNNGGYNNNRYDSYGSSGSGHSVSWILEEAEKSALQKQFEKTYDQFKKKPPPAKGPVF